MSSPRLYKYLDVQGAKLTLGNKNFKHAKPSDFNDLEELTVRSIFPEDEETALEQSCISRRSRIYDKLILGNTATAEGFFSNSVEN